MWTATCKGTVQLSLRMGRRGRRLAGLLYFLCPVRIRLDAVSLFGQQPPASPFKSKRPSLEKWTPCLNPKLGNGSHSCSWFLNHTVGLQFHAQPWRMCVRGQPSPPTRCTAPASDRCRRTCVWTDLYVPWCDLTCIQHL